MHPSQLTRNALAFKICFSFRRLTINAPFRCWLGCRSRFERIRKELPHREVFSFTYSWYHWSWDITRVHKKSWSSEGVVNILFFFFHYSTVGCRRTGLDGPSLERFYFSPLQPISFLFFDPSSSHMAKRVARTRHSISMLHTHATHAWLGKRLKCFDPSKWSRFEVSNAAEKSSSQQTLFASSETALNLVFQPGSFFFLDKIPAWPFFGKPFFGTRQYCTPSRHNSPVIFLEPF